MKLVSWNVNGLRAALRKGLADYVAGVKPDVLCLQETRCDPACDALELLWAGDFRHHWCIAEKRGYSGTAIFTRAAPRAVTQGIGQPVHDREGRVLTAEFADHFVVSVYTPNAQHALARLAYRQEWDAAFLAYLQALEARKPVMVCGDLNVAHEERDLARPKENGGTPGFSPEERAGFRRLVEAGFVDSFREFVPDGGHYTWWSQRGGARARNVGWRIDYCLLSRALRPRLRAAFIHPHVLGSDHCPVGIELADAGE